MKTSVDIVIPTYRPDDQAALLLKKLLTQNYPINHIWIMNTNKNFWNAKFEKISDKIIVEHINKSEFDHGETRHRAIMKSEADIVVCMTQDAIPVDADLIGSLVKALEEEGVGAAYARQLPAKDCSVIERYTRQFNYPPNSRVKSQEDLETLGIKTYFCSNVCAAYDRKLYVEQGGFVRHTIFNEDMIYAAGLVKAGYKIAYAADAQVIHSHNYSGMEQLHRNFDLAVSQADHPEIFQNISSEGEGIRMVKKTALYLMKTAPYLIPQLIWLSGMKYLGYFLGKRYRKLPKGLVLKLTMSADYWGK